MAKQKTNWMNYLGMLALVAVALVGVYSLFGGTLFSAVDTGTGDGSGYSTEQTCPETTPDVTISMVDADNPGTAIPSEVMIYRKEGTTAWTATTTGTAMTNLEPYETYEYVVGITTADAEQYDNAYSIADTFTVKCKETDTIEVEGHNDEVEGSLSATFYNSDDTANTAQTIGAGATKTVYVKFEAGVDEEYGNRFTEDYPNLIAIKLNSTSADDVTRVYIVDAEVGTDGEDMEAVGCPSIVASATGYKFWCFKAPVVTDKGVKLGVTIEADASNAIATDGTAYYYAGNWYIDSNTGELEYGIEDEKGNACGASDPDSLTLDLTA